MSTSLRDQAMDLYSELSETISAESVLNFLICDYLTGAEAFYAMQAAKEEFCGDEEDEEDNITYCGACGGDASICDGC